VPFSKEACLILLIGTKKQPTEKRRNGRGKEKGFAGESQ